MEILKIIGVGLIAAVSFVALRDAKPEIAFLTAAAGCVIIALMLIDYLVEIIVTLTGIAGKVGLDGAIISSILKIIGIGYITEFAAVLCEDMGVRSVADKISLGGKIIIMFLSLPIFTALINLITGLLP
ncbi:MAG: stage III sporulation protein AD [Clostridiales bacterium]|jgi:stage III sporulation protein AD|nr:stage III sporulation protein AD [Clostridiales bacterium]